MLKIQHNIMLHIYIPIIQSIYILVDVDMSFQVFLFSIFLKQTNSYFDKQLYSGRGGICFSYGYDIPSRHELKWVDSNAIDVSNIIRKLQNFSI